MKRSPELKCGVASVSRIRKGSADRHRLQERIKNPEELPREGTESSTAAVRAARDGGEPEDSGPGARPSRAPRREQELGT